MKNSRIWPKALGLGVCAELVVIGSMFAFGSFGPCGPADNFSGMVMWFHVPGFWLAEKISGDGNVIEVLILPVSGAIQFSVLFWVGIFLRRLYGTKQPPQPPSTS